MKLVILSDTHGNTSAVERVYAEQPDAALYLHAGDILSDARYLATLVGVVLNDGEDNEQAARRVIGVTGNSDWPDANQPLARVVAAEGHRILLTHGHSCGVRYGTELLARAAADADCDVAVYGHTHVVEITPGTPITVLCPGSAARPRDAYEPSYLTVELARGQAPEVKLHRMKQF